MLGALRPGHVAVDVGAYKGGYTYWMRRAVGPDGRVIAFEPQRAAAEYLRECVRAFAWLNVTVREEALSSSPGERELRVPGSGPSPGASLLGASLPVGSGSYEVRLETLDRCLAALQPRPSVSFVKCDVEGHEVDVFRGAEETLLRDRPLLLFECEARHDPARPVTDVFAYLERLGYRGFFFWRGELHDVAEFRVAVHQVGGRRPYANNFAFVPAER